MVNHLEISEAREEIAEARKQNYWRGFRTASLLFIPIIIALMIETRECLSLLI